VDEVDFGDGVGVRICAPSLAALHPWNCVPSYAILRMAFVSCLGGVAILLLLVGILQLLLALLDDLLRDDARTR